MTYLSRLIEELKENKLKVTWTKEFYSLEWCKLEPNTLFLFGDNLTHKGKRGQAIIRDEENSLGIITKKYPSNYSTSFFTDNDYEEFKDILDRKLDVLTTHLQSGNFDKIICNENIGAGLAKLDILAPKCYEYLMVQLREFEHVRML